MKQTTQNPASFSFFPSNPIKDAIGDSFQNLPVGYFDTLGTPFALPAFSPYVSITTSVHQNLWADATNFSSIFSSSIAPAKPASVTPTVPALPDVTITPTISAPPAGPTFTITPSVPPAEPTFTITTSIAPTTPAPVDPDPLGTFIGSLPTPAPVDPDPLGSFIGSLPTPAPPDPSPPSVPSSPTPDTPDTPDAPDPGDDASNDGLGDGLGDSNSSGSNGRGDPIVLDLTGKGFNLLDAKTSSAHFDILGGGKQYQTGWAGEGNGLLAYDVDNDSLINHRSEIAFIDYKPGAKTDLEGLTAFDTNQNGWFEKEDAKWNQFGVWEDKNVDGVTDYGEYHNLDSLGIQSIYLTSDHQRSVMNGNIIVRVRDVGNSVATCQTSA